MPFCRNCGNQFEEEEKFCNNCGAVTGEVILVKSAIGNSETPPVKSDRKIFFFDMWAWLLAVIGSFVSVTTIDFFLRREYETAVIGLCFNMIFLIPDFRRLSKSGVKTGVWVWMGLILPFVYLFIRARRTSKIYYTYVLTSVFIMLTCLFTALSDRVDNAEKDLIENTPTVLEMPSSLPSEDGNIDN